MQLYSLMLMHMLMHMYASFFIDFFFLIPEIRLIDCFQALWADIFLFHYDPF
jgi:hypothetical protein